MTRRVVTVSMLLAVPILLGVGYMAFRDYQLRARLAACEACLPEYLSLDTKFSESDHDIGHRDRHITIRDKLLELGAYSANGKIYDVDGREVLFYHMELANQGKGEPKPEFFEWVMKHNARAKELRKQYTVVEMWPTRRPD